MKNSLRYASILFLYVNTPYIIKRIWNIYTNTSILCQFCTRFHAEPCSPNNQTIIAVNVKTLFSSKVFYSTNKFLVAFTHVCCKRQDKRLDMNKTFLSFTIIDGNGTFFFIGCLRMTL